MATSDLIKKTLTDVKTAIDSGKFQPISRLKNRNTLAQLGLTWEDAKSELYELEEADYHTGPMVDNDDFDSDFFWVFKKRVSGEMIYIKFKILYQEDGRVKVVSFHIDE
ncbi:MAG: type II toxin-antitoxin system MqsR family toxin [Ruminiclostridium sp.]|nr:type II toxin-antitoxin system MqsR family toxin [Ruminiclostridium sp.]